METRDELGHGKIIETKNHQKRQQTTPNGNARLAKKKQKKATKKQQRKPTQKLYPNGNVR
jgi:hypothetical protein